MSTSTSSSNSKSNSNLNKDNNNENPTTPPSPKTLQAALSTLPETTLTGSCHCNAVRFAIIHPPLTPQPPPPPPPPHMRHPACQVPVSSCNCSICFRNGYLTIYPEREKITWISGWEGMSTYKFGKRDREHRFCGAYGSSVCIDFLGNWIGDVVGMNVSFLFFFFFFFLGFCRL